MDSMNIVVTTIQWVRLAATVLCLLCLGAIVAGCTALPLKSQQTWRSMVNHEYPSEEVTSAAFEAALDKYTESRTHPAHDCLLLQNGEEAYPEMLRLIAEAKTSISFETYIIENDTVTDRFFAELKNAARRGVRVRVLVDAAGYHRGLIAHLNELSIQGVEARVFNPFFFSWTIIRGNNRDHRKILVVDGCHAILGGINVSDIQCGNGITGWRDTALRISGPGALEAERVFNETWKQGGRGWFGKNLPIAFLNPVKAILDAPFVRDELAPACVSCPAGPEGGAVMPEGGATVRVVASSPDTRSSQTYDLYILGVLGAREKIDVTCAYFVPPLGLRRALLKAAERGVRVRLLLPGVTDVKLVREMGMRFYGQLLEAGVEIYEWPYPILHAKTMAVDGKWLIVGSANMDSRSYFLNYEACLVLTDDATAAEAHEQFERDILNAHEMTLEKWKARSVAQRSLEKLLIPLAGQY